MALRFFVETLKSIVKKSIFFNLVQPISSTNRINHDRITLEYIFCDPYINCKKDIMYIS